MNKATKKLYLISLVYYEDLNEKKKKSINFCSFPIGLLSIATFLKKNFLELDIKILDYGMDYNCEEDLIELISKEKPDYIGFSALSLNKEILNKISSKLKGLFPNILLIAGGPYVSSLEIEDLKNSSIDIFVKGEGEIISLELFKRLLNNKDYGDIKGIIIKKDNKYSFNEGREFIKNINDLPFPDYNLINYEKYFEKPNWGYVKSRYALLESSRGCPFQCIYCHNIFGKKIRLKSSQIIFNEIKKLNTEKNINDFFFIDDIFNIDYQRAIELFDKIIDSGLKINLHFPNGLRGDLMDKDFIDKMIEAGTISVAYAIETPSEKIQQYIMKNLNLSKLKENIIYTCEKGIMVRLFFMYGFPTETREDVEETLAYMKQFKKCIMPYFYAVKYYKGSKLFLKAIEQGFPINKLEEFQKGLYNEFQFCETPLLQLEFMMKAHYRWMLEIILNKERMINAISIQRRYHSEEEIRFFYSSFFGKEINNLNELIKMCHE